ncbi:hypothetical protein PCANC_06005 [Puccinia coronata f. sp. avenae]|uniref:Uncharacterized protein n=1 Tax=Puccinia coronata f. sp. avenae TaxID=200324 RepID=A0A2N5VTV8_9BASI|nr:hypothetical protein PCANC_06005 [Puccinia coronata f. sp. avenae]
MHGICPRKKTAASPWALAGGPILKKRGYRRQHVCSNAQVNQETDSPIPISNNHGQLAQKSEMKYFGFYCPMQPGSPLMMLSA